MYGEDAADSNYFFRKPQSIVIVWESPKKSSTHLHFRWFSAKSCYFRLLGKFHSLWVKICWSWNSNNRNIVTARAEFIAGDWIMWWRFKFRLYAKKKLSNFIFKRFENFHKIFSFSKFEKSENFRFLLLEFQKIFLRFLRFLRFRKYFSDFQKTKLKNFQIFRFWKMKIFSENFQIF